MSGLVQHRLEHQVRVECRSRHTVHCTGQGAADQIGRTDLFQGLDHQQRHGHRFRQHGPPPLRAAARTRGPPGQAPAAGQPGGGAASTASASGRVSSNSLGIQGKRSAVSAIVLLRCANARLFPLARIRLSHIGGFRSRCESGQQFEDGARGTDHPRPAPAPHAQSPIWTGAMTSHHAGSGSRAQRRRSVRGPAPHARWSRHRGGATTAGSPSRIRRGVATPPP